MGLYLCGKCGWVRAYLSSSTTQVCPVCNSKVFAFEVDEDAEFYDLSKIEQDKWRFSKQPLDAYDVDLWNKRIAYDGERWASVREKENQFNATHPECPYCHKRNTKKNSTTAKAVNTGMFGILGTKRHYQWHCNNCGSDF